MNVVLLSDAGEHELEITLNDAGAPVSELVGALLGGVKGAEGVGASLLVDGCYVAPHLSIAEAGLHEGSMLEVGCPPVRPSWTTELPVAELRVVGGLSAGAVVPLAPGLHVLGREATDGVDIVVDDPTISARHAHLLVDAAGGCVLSDLGSLNGTRIGDEFVSTPRPVQAGDVIQLGAVQLTVGPSLPLSAGTGRSGDRGRGQTAALGSPGPRGTVTFNRPSRRLRPDVPVTIRMPSSPPTPAPGARFGWAALLAPVVMGVGLAIVFKSPSMAAFILLSPVMMLGNWIEDRRRVKKQRIRGAKELATRLERFRGQLAEAARAETRRRCDELADPAEVAWRAAGPSPRLWERRPQHGDFLRLSVGMGTVPWSPPVAGGHDDPPEGVDGALVQASFLSGSPVAVDLSEGQALGVVGPRRATLALLRSLVCQAAVCHGPADLRVAVLTQPDRRSDWEWAKWLPHTRSFDESSGRRLLAATSSDVEVVLAELAHFPPAPASSTQPGRRDEAVTAMSPGPITLMVVDADGLTEGRSAPARALLGGSGRPLAGIVVAPSADRLPATCTSVMIFDGPTGMARYSEPSGGLSVEDVLVSGCLREWPVLAPVAWLGWKTPRLPMAADVCPPQSRCSICSASLSCERDGVPPRSQPDGRPAGSVRGMRRRPSEAQRSPWGQPPEGGPTRCGRRLGSPRRATSWSTWWRRSPWPGGRHDRLRKE